MTIGIAGRILAAILLLLGAAAGVSAMGWFPRETEGWQRQVFDGSEFRTGPSDGGFSVWVRSGYLPSGGGGGAPADGQRLPPGFGAVAGYCFVQQAGGKLAGKESRHPQAGVAVRIVGDGLTREATTDEGGYFAAVLPPGSYELQGRAGTARVEVESGRTVLVGLRAGKRMVD